MVIYFLFCSTDWHVHFCASSKLTITIALCCCCCLVVKSCQTFLRLHGLQPTRLLCPWDFPGKNTEVGCHFLLQGIFLTQGLNLHPPLGLSWESIHLRCGRPGFDPWVGKIPWRRERLPTPVFWPGEFHGLYSPWGGKELDTTERLFTSLLHWQAVSFYHRATKEAHRSVRHINYSRTVTSFWASLWLRL